MGEGSGAMKPNEVFTPRAANVNSDMYVNRADLESRLGRAIDGTQHLIIFGDSGSGKTWLYNQYMQRQGISFRRVDLSVAATDSLDHAFLEAMVKRDEWVPTNKNRSTIGGADYVVKATREESTSYEPSKKSAFDELVADFSGAGTGPKFLVLDNLEQVATNNEIIQALASYVIRLDNPRFAELNLRFLLVGVIADMRELVARYDQAGTVANRLTELPEVQKLTEQEARELILRGMKEKLKYRIEDEDRLVNEVVRATERNAQQVHSLCYQIACEAELNGRSVDGGSISRGKQLWIEESLAQHMSMVENRLNRNEARWQRRNQVLYCLGQADTAELKAGEIEESVKREFPHTIESSALRVDQVMAALAKDENPLLIRNPLERSYRFAHPKIKLAIGALLAKDEKGDVTRV